MEKGEMIKRLHQAERVAENVVRAEDGNLDISGLIRRPLPLNEAFWAIMYASQIREEMDNLKVGVAIAEAIGN
jgi:hypothetical protein